MAQYWEDWSGSTIGAAPTGWEALYDTAGVTYVVQSETDTLAPAGRRLRITGSSLARRLLRMLAVDSDPDRTDFEVKLLCKVPSYTGDTVAVACGGRAVDRENHMLGGLARLSGTYRLYAGEYVSNTFTALSTGVAGDWTAGTVYWVTLRASGSNVTISLAAGATPGTVITTRTVTGALASIGSVGIVSQGGGLTADVFAVGIGTNGDSAPTAAPTAAVKGVRLQLHTKTGTPRTTTTGITAMWWDAETPSGAPTYETATATLDASGWLEIDLDATTALDLADNGHLKLYKAGATPDDDLHYSGRVPVVDIA